MVIIATTKAIIFDNLVHYRISCDGVQRTIQSSGFAPYIIYNNGADWDDDADMFTCTTTDSLEYVVEECMEALAAAYNL